MEQRNKKRSSLPRYTVPARRTNQPDAESVDKQQILDKPLSKSCDVDIRPMEESCFDTREKIMSVVDRFLGLQSNDRKNHLLMDRHLSIDEATTAFLLAAPHIDASLEKHDFPLSCEIAEILGKKKIWTKLVEEIYAEKYGKKLMGDWVKILDPSVVKIHDIKSLTFLKKRTSFALPEPDENTEPKFPSPPWVVSIMKVLGGQALVALEDEVFLHRMSRFLRTNYRTLGGVDKFRPDFKKLLLAKEKPVVIVLVGRHEYARAILVNRLEHVDEARVYLMDLGHMACIDLRNIFLPPPSYQKLNPLSFWVNLWQLEGCECEDPIYQAAIWEILGDEGKFWAVPVKQGKDESTVQHVVGSWGGMPVALLKTTRNEDGTVKEACLNLQIRSLVDGVHSTVGLVEVGQVVNGATITSISEKNQIFVVFNVDEFCVLEAALVQRLEDSAVCPVREVEPFVVYLIKRTISIPGVLQECRAFRAVKSVAAADEKADADKITMVAFDCGLTVEVDPRNVFDLINVSPVLGGTPVKGCFCKLDLPSWNSSHDGSSMLSKALDPIRKKWTGRRVTIVVVSPQDAVPRVIVMENVEEEPKEKGAKLGCLNLLVEEVVAISSS